MPQPWWDWDKPKVKGLQDLELLEGSSLFHPMGAQVCISSSRGRTGTWSGGDVPHLGSSLLFFPPILRIKGKVSPHGG